MYSYRHDMSVHMQVARKLHHGSGDFEAFEQGFSSAKLWLLSGLGRCLSVSARRRSLLSAIPWRDLWRLCRQAETLNRQNLLGEWKKRSLNIPVAIPRNSRPSEPTRETQVLQICPAHAKTNAMPCSFIIVF